MRCRCSSGWAARASSGAPLAGCTAARGAKGRAYGVDASVTHYSSETRHPRDALRFGSVRRDVWFGVPSHAARSLQGDTWMDLVTADAMLHQDDRIDSAHRPLDQPDKKPILGKTAKRDIAQGMH